MDIEKRELVTSDSPVAVLTGVFPEYTYEGIAVDYGEVILSRHGEATLRINFQKVSQKKNNIVILFPGDVVMVEKHSPDFELEYFTYTGQVQQMALSELDPISFEAIRAHNTIDSPEIAAMVESMFVMLNNSLKLGSIRDDINIAALLLRTFFIGYKGFLVKKGHFGVEYASRSQELFTKFTRLLSANFKTSRSVDYYAQKLNITTKYLTNICNELTNKPAKSIIDDYAIMQIRLALRENDMPISDIAYLFNFSSTPFFCEYFKRHANITPQKYRDKFQSR